MAVAPWIVSNGLWERIEPLLPKRQRRFRYPGRKPLPDREALQGILFVPHTRDRMAAPAARAVPRRAAAAGRPGDRAGQGAPGLAPLQRPRPESFRFEETFPATADG
jgi:transposase